MGVRVADGEDGGTRTGQDCRCLLVAYPARPGRPCDSPRDSQPKAGGEGATGQPRRRRAQVKQAPERARTPDGRTHPPRAGSTGSRSSAWWQRPAWGRVLRLRVRCPGEPTARGVCWCRRGGAGRGSSRRRRRRPTPIIAAAAPPLPTLPPAVAPSPSYAALETRLRMAPKMVRVRSPVLLGAKVLTTSPPTDRRSQLDRNTEPEEAVEVTWGACPPYPALPGHVGLTAGLPPGIARGPVAHQHVLKAQHAHGRHRGRAQARAGLSPPLPSLGVGGDARSARVPAS